MTSIYLLANYFSYLIYRQWTVAMISAKTERSERSDLSETERSAAPIA